MYLTTVERVPSNRTLPKTSDVLLIVGTGNTVWDDVEEFWDFEIPHDVCCINRVGIVFPCNFAYWYSIHTEDLCLKWWAKDKSPTVQLHGRFVNDSVVQENLTCYKYPSLFNGATSSFDAAVIAILCWGYTKIVLAGVPLNKGYQWILPCICRAAPKVLHFSEKVRSMSGNTAKLFGKPTKEWLWQPFS